MKLLALFVAILSVATATWTPLSQEDFLKAREECFDQEKVSTANRELIKKQNYPEDGSVDCYIRCVGLKTGTWDDRNGFSVDRMYEMFTSRDLVVSKENLRGCFSFVADVGVCQWSGISMRCLWDNKYLTRKN